MSFCFGILCTIFFTGGLPSNRGFEGLGRSWMESGTMYSWTPPSACNVLCLIVRSLLHALLNVDWGGWVLCVNSTGFVTVLIFSVATWIQACFSAAPPPDTFTGVAPKVLLGVTLGPHDICRVWVLLPGLLVRVTLGGVGADLIGALPLTFAWLLVVGPANGGCWFRGYSH
jgi:hypothetical protein